jgi:hypothetical protein
MRVALDASAAAAGTHWVGHYVAHLTDALLAEDPGSSSSPRRATRTLAAPEARASPLPSSATARDLLVLALALGGRLVHGPDDRLAGSDGPQVVTIHDLFSLKREAGGDDALRRRARDATPRWSRRRAASSA